MGSLKHIRQAYDDLKLGVSASQLTTSQSRLAFEERRDNADVVMLQMLVYLLD